MRIAVTGASGFVGGAVCRAAVAVGATVYGYGRRAIEIPAVRYRSWDLCAGPLTNPAEVDAVIHCAGSVTDWGSPAEQWAANVTGTANVLATFCGARIVHISTASVYHPRRPTVRAREEQAPVHHYLNAYGASKAAAEQLVSRTRPDAVILRPHAVYGPGDTTVLPRVLRAVRRGRLIAVGSGRQLISLTSINNLTRACLLAVNGPPGIYNIADAEPVSLAKALSTLLAERGISASPVFVPLALAAPIATLAEMIFRVLSQQNPPPLTRYTVHHLAHERTLDLTRAHTQLGFNPTPTSFTGAATW